MLSLHCGSDSVKITLEDCRDTQLMTAHNQILRVTLEIHLCVHLSECFQKGSVEEGRPSVWAASLHGLGSWAESYGEGELSTSIHLCLLTAGAV